MNSDERRKLLHAKLVANQLKLAAKQQGLFREKYLAQLPEQLGTYLERCPYVQSPKLDEITVPFYIWPEGIARNAFERDLKKHSKPIGYVYREFSWLDQLLEASLSVGNEHDDEMAFFYPFIGPVYQVPFGWVRKNVVELFSCKSHTSNEVTGQMYCPERVGVVTTDFKVGLVLDCCGGYLEPCLNHEETVYQLATWGIGSACD